MVQFQIFYSFFILSIFLISLTQQYPSFLKEYQEQKRNLWACPEVPCHQCLTFPDRQYCSLKNSNGYCCTLDDEREICKSQHRNCSGELNQFSNEKYLTCHYDADICGQDPNISKIPNSPFYFEHRNLVLAQTIKNSSMSSQNNGTIIQTKKQMFHQNQICVWIIKKNETQKSLELNIEEITNAEIYYFQGNQTFSSPKSDEKNISSPTKISIDQFGDKEYVYLIGRSLGAEARIKFRAISFNDKRAVNNNDTSPNNNSSNSSADSNETDTNGNSTGQNNNTNQTDGKNQTDNSTDTNNNQTNTNKTNNGNGTNNIVNPPEEEETNEKSSTLLIVGLAVGGCGLLGVSIFLIYYLCRRKDRAQRKRDYELQQQEEENLKKSQRQHLKQKQETKVMGAQPSATTNYNKVQEELSDDGYNSDDNSQQANKSRHDNTGNLDTSKKRQQELIMEEFNQSQIEKVKKKKSHAPIFPEIDGQVISYDQLPFQDANKKMSQGKLKLLPDIVQQQKDQKGHFSDIMQNTFDEKSKEGIVQR